MPNLFKKLTPQDFSSGWPVFWRVNMPYWVRLIHMGAAIVLGYQAESRWGDALAVRWPWLIRSPLMGFLLSVLLCFLILWPLERWFHRVLQQRVEADFWRSQFALVDGLTKLSQGLSTLLAALFLSALWGQAQLPTDHPVLRTIVVLFAATLVGVLVMFVGLYGWLARQWGELVVEKRRD